MIRGFSAAQENRPAGAGAGRLRARCHMNSASETMRGAQCVIDRRCPECEHHDRVITSRLAAELWHRRHAYIAEELEALADALASGLAPAVPHDYR